ncbi:tubulin delta chain-like [Leptopilina heterotoma]|uniref:tubulin delta chain-like n=1 Tax=Leptopilina heterotoma TaxID=63436 RepID=UPI001CA869F1|nr:tubulin delta chain-like [Leptopilina heterotoma]XP_043477851.1 tubulin delta chain-like [Leptopilina heterotoma]
MLTLQFGQCGNQLGHNFFTQLSTDINSRDKNVSRDDNYQYTESAIEKWFEGINNDGCRLARTILIDTEAKVLKNICRQTNSQWTYRKQNLICQTSGGSANNWAYGYLMKGPQFKEETLEAIRREIERTDRLEGMLFLLSSAGGTGSGVGSYFIDNLREEFPTKTLIGSIILPFTSGEVGTQNYNTLLTLAKFNEKCDINFLFENEQIHSICTSILKNFDANLKNINDVISRKLAAIFQPVENCLNANSLVSLVTPHPSYKLASIKSVPYIPLNSSIYESSYKWHSHIGHLKQTLRVGVFNDSVIDPETRKISHAPYDRNYHKYCKSIGNILITRGTSLENDSIVYDELKKNDLYAKWMPELERFTHFNQRRRLLNQEKFVALITNNSQIHRSLEIIVDRAWKMYTHGAFLHQYKKFGLEEDDFLHSFAKVENIVKSYRELDNE